MASDHAEITVAAQRGVTATRRRVAPAQTPGRGIRALCAAIGLVLLTGIGQARAETAYRCLGAQGAVAFQDHPCPIGQQQDLLQLPASAVAPVATDTTDQAPPEMPPAAPAAAQPRHTLPALWACLRYDGAQYMSSTGVPQTQAVPLGILGYPAQSLGQVYGASRSGLAPAAGRGASARGNNGYAADYVWTQDRCVPASYAQICRYLHQQFDENHRALRDAPRTQAAALEAHERELREQLGGC